MKSNFLDKAISFFDPKAGASRMRARAMSVLLENQIRKYEAASKGRRTNGWATVSTSANREIYTAGHNLRERARDLVRNNPYAAKAINTIANNVIGTGIRATPKPSNKKSEPKIKTAWEDWAEKTECDFNGQLNFYGLQDLAMRCIAESGEVLIRKRRDKSAKLPMKLQILEPDFLDSSRDGITSKDGSYIIQGIEFNAEGKRVAYWLWDRHPSDTLPYSYRFTSSRIDASEIIHVYFIERPGQERGVPFGVSGFARLKDFDDYEDAQLLRQKIAACFAVFITDPSEGLPATGDKDSATGNTLEKVEPGIIEHLPPGKTVSFANPPATDGYAEYSRKILQAIAAAYGITYEQLTGELKDVNFSSGRMGWIEAAKQINSWQWKMIVPMFLDKVWGWFLEAGFMAGSVPKAIEVEWTPPRREMIDPVKEIKALTDMVRAGFKSWSEAVREQGYDPMTVLDEIIKDSKEFDKGKLMLSSDARYDATRKSDTPPPADGNAG